MESQQPLDNHPADAGAPGRWAVAGTYVAALWLGRPQAIQVGRLGTVELPGGWYLYVGSARGPGGLGARIARHRKRLGASKRAHWHMDAVREHATWAGAWARAGRERLECEWAARLASLSGAQSAARGLGASDCRCRTHLVSVPELPEEGWFAAELGAERVWMGDEELDELVAALGLGQYGVRALPALAGVLGSPDPDARWWAARGLAEAGGEGSAGLLVTALADADADVRACAALALGRLGAAPAAPALAARLADESTFVAGIAADALGMIGEAAVPALAEMLGHGRPHVRLLAVRALARTRSQRAAAPLFGVLEDSSYLVRYYALEAIDALGAGMVYFSP